MINKLLKVLKQFATVWKQVSAQLHGSTRTSEQSRRLADRQKLPELSNEMVRLGLFWVRPTSPPTSPRAHASGWRCSDLQAGWSPVRQTVLLCSRQFQLRSQLQCVHGSVH